MRYIIGYALPESEKYVLSKTWYADEMQRLGCVWTHSLILDIDSMGKMDSPGELLKLFHRSAPEKYDDYTVPIRIMQKDTMQNVKLELLQYVVYTIYITDHFRYVEIQDNRYAESVILAVCHMSKQLLVKFSFCLDSLVNRYIDGVPFSYHIVMVAVAINKKLIMSDDIWTLPRNYQCDIINVLDSSISYSEWLEILSKILKECNEDISEAVYNKAQEKLVPALLELFQDGEMGWPLERAFIWDRYLLDDQVRLCQSMLKISRPDLRKHWLLKVNIYSDKIRNSISVCERIELFQSCSFEYEDEKKVWRFRCCR